MNMKTNRNYSLADILGAALAPLAQAAAPAIDVESVCLRRDGIPAPVKAIFNLKTEDMVPVLDDDGNPVYAPGKGENSPKRLVRQAKTLEKPILASKVFFEDGSWTVVKNSGEDTVDVEEKKLPGGKTVKTATDASKERALAYAVVKRAFGKVDPATKEVKGANLGRRFEKVIKASVDQNLRAGSETGKPEDKKPAPNAEKTCRRGKRENAARLGDFIKNLENAVTDLAKTLDAAEKTCRRGA